MDCIFSANWFLVSSFSSSFCQESTRLTLHVGCLAFSAFTRLSVLSPSVMIRVMLQVVVKFIRKSKVAMESWVETRDHRRLPSEVSLLLNLRHPNIVKVM